MINFFIFYIILTHVYVILYMLIQLQKCLLSLFEF